MKFFLIIYMSLNFASMQCNAGGAVGNGGGFARCTDGNLYEYDYLITSQNTRLNDRLSLTLDEQIQIIANQLERLDDPLFFEFNQFTHSLFKQEPKYKFQWFPISPLLLLYDPGLEQLLPSTCRERHQGAHYFAPIPGLSTVSYKYDLELFKQVLLQQFGEIQISYLLIHEWLWNYFDPENRIKLADFNRLLHSEEIKIMNKEEYYRRRPQIKN